jgi:hypothetical protein
MPLSRINNNAIANNTIVAADLAAGSVTGDKIASSVTLTTPIISGNLSLDSTGTTGVRVPSANTMAFYEGGVEAMRIDSNGNMGIGASSISNKLEVVQSASADASAAVRAGTNGYAASLKLIANDVTGSRYNILSSFYGSTEQWSIRSGAADSTITFCTGSSATERMRIDSSGNLLIGTTSTSTVISGKAVNLSGSGNVGYRCYGGGTSVGHFYNTSGDTTIIGSCENSGAVLAFHTGASAGSERMRILSGGNVLIGITSLYGSERVRIYTDSNANDYALYAANVSGSGYHGIRSEIAGSGNNTSTWHFIGVTAGINAYYLYGNGTTSYSSDERLKKNIETTRNGYLEDLAKLRVVKYNWLKDEENTPKELGLIAQEVEQVFPNLIQEHELEGVGIRKNIKHSVMEFILIKAIQELKAELDSVKAELQTLKEN